MKKYYILLILLSQTQTYSQCWKSVSAGAYFTIAIKTDGTLWACGDNAFGQLGDGTYTYRNSFVQIGTDTNWKIVSAGASHTLALKNNGTLWAWGTNDDGELGLGNNYDRNQPTQVGTNNDWMFIKARSAGSSAIKNNGELFCWGRNDYGQLGIGNSGADILSPTIVLASVFNPYKSVSGRDTDFMVGLTYEGKIYAWGLNAYGQLGNPFASFYQNMPLQIGNNSNWKEISAGFHFCLALKTDGTLWAWGRNEYGALGNSALTIQQTPIQIGTDRWLHITAGSFHTMGIKEDNTLWTWGQNGDGRLGNGTTVNQYTPTQISNASTFDLAIPGFNHSFALKTDGSLIGMGSDTLGQLNNPNNMGEPALFPVTIDCPFLTADEYVQNEDTTLIYPNPVKETLHINTKSDTSINKLTIIDLTGKIVLEKGNTSELNVQMLQNGIYVLQIQSENNYYQKKFIKN